MNAIYITTNYDNHLDKEADGWCCPVDGWRHVSMTEEYTVELLCDRGCKHLQNGDFCSKYNKILFAYFIDTVKCKDCWEDKDE